jgi:DNA end-binding protein Ku
VPLSEVDVKEEELRLAVQLIEQTASDAFHPEKYKDSVRERMLELIERKVAGEDITVTPAYEPEHKIIDLMEALKASIAASGGAAPKRKPAKRATPKTAAGPKRTAHTK